MRSALPLFRTPAAPWAMVRAPHRTAAAMPKRSPPLQSIDCRMASTLIGALSSADEPEALNRSDFDASIMLYRGRIDLEPGHQAISWIPAGECGQSTSPRSVRTAGFILPDSGCEAMRQWLVAEARYAPSGAYDRSSKSPRNMRKASEIWVE